MSTAIIAIAAAIAVFTALRAAIGPAIATNAAVESAARQPEADGSITKLLMLGAALAEGTAIFGLVVAILIILFLG